MLKKGTCEACPSGTYKDADGHFWLECLEKSAEACDQNDNEDVVTHFCANLDDLTASRPLFPFGQCLRTADF